MAWLITYKYYRGSLGYEGEYIEVSRHYSLDDKNLIERTLCELFPPEWLRDKAKETGLIKHERKIDPVILFWTLAIGHGTFLQRTLAGLKRNYESTSKI